jgi:hypothetical protein
MAHDEDGGMAQRKGKLSAFALLKSWLFDKKTSRQRAHNETEFLNTRDGYELARFAQKAFGGDAEAKKAHEAAAVEAEQAEIDALLQGTGAVPMPTAAALASACPRPWRPRCRVPRRAGTTGRTAHRLHPARPRSRRRLPRPAAEGAGRHGRALPGATCAARACRSRPWPKR